MSNYKILEKQIDYLSKDADRIKKIRLACNVNPHFEFEREADTIRSLYDHVLKTRETVRGNHIMAGTGGWTVNYHRKKKTFKKDEKFWIHIFFSFVETDNFD